MGLKRLVLLIMSLGVFIGFTNTNSFANIPPEPDPEKEEPKWVWKFLGKDSCGCWEWGWDNECIQLKVAFGKAVNQPLMPQSYFLLRHNRPSPTITTPQGLYFSSPFSSFMFSPKNVSGGVTIEIVKGDGMRIKFRINDGESEGVPCDQYAGTPTRIKRLDENGSAVTSDPHYYEIDFGDGVTCRYLATSKKVYSITTAEGVVLSQSDKEIGQEIIRDSSGNLRQVWSAADGLADIVVPDGQAGIKYEIRLYAHSEFGDKDGNGLYAINQDGTPHTVWVIENTDSPSLDKIRFTKTVGESSTVANWQYNSNNDSWDLDNAGLQKTIKNRQWDTAKENLLITEWIKESDDTIRSKTTQSLHKYSSPLIGTVTTQKSVYIDASNKLDTNTSYYDDISSSSLKYGQIKLVGHPNGGWEKYDYDSLGRKNSTIKPLKNATSTATSSIRTTSLSFTSHDTADTPLANDTRPRTVEEKIDSATIKKTYYVYKTVSNEAVEIKEIAGTPNAAYGATENLRTTKVYYASSVAAPAGGRVKSITYPDGRKDSISYEYGNISNPGTPDQVTFTVDPDNGSATRVTTIHGTTSSPNGVAYKTTKDTKIINATGDTVLEESYAYDGTNYNRVTWGYMIYNNEHKVTSKYATKNTQVNATWNCCNLDSNTTNDGTEYTYGYDLLKRMTTKTKKGVSGSTPDIVTTYTYDAAGRQLSESTTDGTKTLTSSKTYDWAGRVLTSTDVSGLVTSYSYTAANSTTGDIVTITYPGGGTKITEKYFDGRIKSITGTSVVAKYYDYGVESSTGYEWTKESIGSSSSTRYTKTYTNAIDKVAKIEKSGYNSSTLTTQFYYNNSGQLYKKTQTGLADTLYEYDSLGNMTRSGLDINGDDVLTLVSTDRISDSDTVFSQISSDWWLVITKKTYATINSSTATTTSVNKIRLTGLASGVINEFKKIDIHGNETTYTTLVNRTTKTVTKTINVPNSNIDKRIIIVNGLVTSTRSASNLTYAFAYDGLGRRTGVTDPRTGQVTTAYYTTGTGKKGKVYTVTDAASNVTIYDYNTSSGRLASVKNALNKYTYYDYNTRGQVTKTWGDTGYPIEKGYDSYGQNTTLKTYRAGTGWTASTWPTTTGTADITTWAYDASSGLVTSKTFANDNSVSYTYTNDGKPSTRTWARQSGGQALTTTYSYDSNTGEQTGIDYSDSTQDITYSYTRTGQQYQVTDSVGTRTFAYNSALQPSTETITAGLYGKTLTRNYATTGVVGRYTGINISTEYTRTLGYDTYGRINSVSDGTDTFTYGFVTNSDLVASVTRPNNLSTDYSYEANRNLLTTVANKYNTSTTISSYVYRYDAIGRRRDVVNTGTAFSTSNLIKWTYNDHSELTDAEKYNCTTPDSPTNAVTSYDYALAFDNIGNRLSDTTSTGGTATTYTVNNLNQYTATANPTQSLTYDNDGGMLTDGTGWNNTWNGENRLIETYNDTAGYKLTFEYDYMGRRVEKKVYTGTSGTSWTLSTHEKFVYDGYKCIEVLNGANSNAILQKFLWNGEELLSVYDTAATATYYYFADANKNIGQLMDNGGNTVAKYEYSPFGVQTLSTGTYATTNPFRFSSEYYDSETALVYYNYRYYNTTLGRWLSRDPIAEKGELNLYNFIRGNPVNKFDLLGLCSSGPLSWACKAANKALLDELRHFREQIGGLDDKIGRFSSKINDETTKLGQMMLAFGVDPVLKAMNISRDAAGTAYNICLLENIRKGTVATKCAPHKKALDRINKEIAQRELAMKLLLQEQEKVIKDLVSAKKRLIKIKTRLQKMHDNRVKDLYKAIDSACSCPATSTIPTSAPPS